ncbi:MAG TPA: hypothetical protein VKE29_07660 [Candidatus Udaeobacter sp.]|nr:hypothetical protein [Candidatus Udaeobacter sp.]
MVWLVPDFGAIRRQLSDRFIANISPLNLGGFAAVHESAFGPKRTFLLAPHMSAFGGKADI